ncbi:MAG: 6,7-dimethyl-8-ribityllumazine synthase [Alphaproteobacteria bacterium]
MNQSSQKLTKGQRIALIQARWHGDIVDEARKSFIAEIASRSNTAPNIDIFDVPGAFEIPLQARLLARSGTYAAIIACGFVVDGGIYRHDFVAEAVVSGLMQVQLESDVPVLSVVLTPHQFHECEEHRHFFLEHFKVKGREAAEACVQVLSLREEIMAAA